MPRSKPKALLWGPPELKSFSKFSVRIFLEKSSDFVQRSEPVFSYQNLRFSRQSFDFILIIRYNLL
ncbi:MAG: hypothetical protein COT41_02950 [Candidatus Portnoybacteria bacterium CG08_land_8_20_14_0_20_40_83]|nr:MAG: hypothetical protein COT41_02950 [Candidatus Portnoybacteria bacterium CG08_land_8_20_14_0_20_40_83]